MIVFLAGGHGVGKTFLGKPAAESLGFRHATASTLIREELGVSSWDSQKYVKDIDRNQEALIAAVSRINSTDVNLVLDGHFVLRNSIGNLSALPLFVFERLNIKGVILLEAPASVVYQRLAERSAPQTLEKIEELSIAELNHAELICSKLSIPLMRLEMPDEIQVRDTIKMLA